MTGINQSDESISDMLSDSEAAELMDAASKYIGIAHMDEEGTIELRLRAGGEGIIAHGVMVYAKDNPDYARIIAHLGGLKPGETKSVLPWTEVE